MVLFVQTFFKLFSKARQARLDAEKEIQIAAQELLDVQQVRHKIEVEGIVFHRVASCFIVLHRVPLCPLCPLCPFFHHFYQILLTD
jgi:hypothetical protein